MTNLSNIMKAAHEMTRTTIEAGDNYGATFAACLAVAWEDARIADLAERIERSSTFVHGVRVWTKNNSRRLYINYAATADYIDLNTIIWHEASRSSFISRRQYNAVEDIRCEFQDAVVAFA